MPRKKKRAVRAKREQKESVNLDIIVSIFRYLDKATLFRCARVCKLWRQAAYVPCLWKNYMFLAKEDGLNMDAALSLKERKISAVRFRLDQLVAEGANGVKKMPAAKTAQAIRHQKMPISASLLHCAQVAAVETILLQGSTTRTANVRFDMSELTTNPLMPAQFDSLKHLFMYNVDLLEQRFQAALQNLSNLEQLNISWFGIGYMQPYSNQMRHVQRFCSFDVICIVLSSLPTLRDLELCHVAWKGSEEGSDVRLTHNDDATLPYLERLALKGVGQISAQTVADICKKFPGLKHLELTLDQLSRINEGTIRALAIPSLDNLISFRVMDRDGFGSNIPTSANILNMLTLAPNLKAFESNRLQCESLRNLIDIVPQLSVLKLSEYQEFDEQALFGVIQNMKDLEVLSVQAYKMQITKPVELSLLMKRKLTKLQSFFANIKLSDLDEMRTLEYKWAPDSDVISKRCILPDSAESVWTEVQTGTADWMRAIGYQYFHPGKSFCMESFDRPGLELSKLTLS